MEGVPLAFFEVFDVGIIGAILVIGFLLLTRGVIKTKGEVDRIVQSYLDRIEELREHHQQRIADKDAIIAERERTNRENLETIRVILDTLDGYGDHLANLDRQGAVTLQVMEALQRATERGGEYAQGRRH